MKRNLKAKTVKNMALVLSIFMASSGLPVNALANTSSNGQVVQASSAGLATTATKVYKVKVDLSGDGSTIQVVDVTSVSDLHKKLKELKEEQSLDQNYVCNWKYTSSTGTNIHESRLFDFRLSGLTVTLEKSPKVTIYSETASLESVSFENVSDLKAYLEDYRITAKSNGINLGVDTNKYTLIWKYQDANGNEGYVSKLTDDALLPGLKVFYEKAPKIIIYGEGKSFEVVSFHGIGALLNYLAHLPVLPQGEALGLDADKYEINWRYTAVTGEDAFISNLTNATLLPGLQVALYKTPKITVMGLGGTSETVSFHGIRALTNYLTNLPSLPQGEALGLSKGTQVVWTYKAANGQEGPISDLVNATLLPGLTVTCEVVSEEAEEPEVAVTPEVTTEVTVEPEVTVTPEVTTEVTVEPEVTVTPEVTEIPEETECTVS